MLHPLTISSITDFLQGVIPLLSTAEVALCGGTVLTELIVSSRDACIPHLQEQLAQHGQVRVALTSLGSVSGQAVLLVLTKE